MLPLSISIGKLNPTTAFMSGKLKMEGNLGKALALEKVMKKMNQRGYHTSARLATFNDTGNLSIYINHKRKSFAATSRPNRLSDFDETCLI